MDFRDYVKQVVEEELYSVAAGDSDIVK